MDATITIRPAAKTDAVAINDIYNHYVLTSTCTYQETPESLPDRLAWLARHGADHPVIVAVEHGAVVGWAAASAYHDRTGYRRTVQNGVYIREGSHRRGIGRALMKELISRCRAAGHHTIIAGISSEQAASVALHRSLGFEEVAHLREVGFKLGRWLDVLYLQLML